MFARGTKIPISGQDGEIVVLRCPVMADVQPDADPAGESHETASDVCAEPRLVSRGRRAVADAREREEGRVHVDSTQAA